jgi:hypothetical protein
MKIKNTSLSFLLTLFLSFNAANTFCIDSGTGLMLSGLGLIFYDHYPQISSYLSNNTDYQNDSTVIKQIDDNDAIKFTTVKLPKEFFEEEKNTNFFQIPQNLEELHQKISANKISFCGFGLIFYGALLRKLNAGMDLLNDPNKWASYKAHLSPDKFYEIPHNKLLEELQNTINVYYNQNKSIKIIEPTLTFLKDIRSEIKNLERYLSYYYFLEKTFLYLLFPNFQDTIFQAEEALEKLHYLEELVIENSIYMNP